MDSNDGNNPFSSAQVYSRRQGRVVAVPRGLGSRHTPAPPAHLSGPGLRPSVGHAAPALQVASLENVSGWALAFVVRVLPRGARQLGRLTRDPVRRPGDRDT